MRIPVVTQSLSAQPTCLCQQDWEYAAIQARGGSGEALRLLRRVAPYMRGANHIEDIMWRENLPRGDIMNRMLILSIL